MPVGDGVILAIQNDGKLLWYKYLGLQLQPTDPRHPLSTRKLLAHPPDALSRMKDA